MIDEFSVCLKARGKYQHNYTAYFVKIKNDSSK